MELLRVWLWTIGDRAKVWNGGTANNGTLQLGTTGVIATGTCASSSASFWYNGRNGKRSSAGSFDGQDDAAVIPNHSILEPADSITISAWFKASGNTGSEYIIAKERTENSNRSYWITYDGSVTQFGIVYNEVASNALSPKAQVTAGSWYHVVGTYDKFYLRIYLNGREWGNGTANSSGINYNGASGNQDLFIAKASTNGAGNYNGLIDEVKIWNYALTEEQIWIEYNGGAVRFGN